MKNNNSKVFTLLFFCSLGQNTPCAYKMQPNFILPTKHFSQIKSTFESATNKIYLKCNKVCLQEKKSLKISHFSPIDRSCFWHRVDIH